MGQAHRSERDPMRDVVPVVASTLVAWWTTVRPAGFYPGSTWGPKVAALVALTGLVVAATAVLRRARHVSALLLGGFVVPAAGTWWLGPEGATALADPVEVFVGAIAWAALGLVLIRPEAVALPRGAQGGHGPSIGAGDDVARVAMRELDASWLDRVEEPAPKLIPRQATPRLASLPLWSAAALAALVALQTVRVASSVADRAVLARVVGAAVALGLLSTAGDLVEVRYLGRTPAPPRTRVQRAAAAIAVVAVLAVMATVWLRAER